MKKDELYEFMARRRLGVVSSTSGGAPQSALVGVAVTSELEIVFDTLQESRKARNLVVDTRCSVVLWDGEVTVQYEGLAEEHGVNDEGPWKESYFAAWPECREHVTWPSLVYFVLRPKWIRYSDFNKRPPEFVEFTF